MATTIPKAQPKAQLPDDLRKALADVQLDTSKGGPAVTVEEVADVKKVVESWVANSVGPLSKQSISAFSTAIKGATKATKEPAAVKSAAELVAYVTGQRALTFAGGFNPTVTGYEKQGPYAAPIGEMKMEGQCGDRFLKIRADRGFGERDLFVSINNQPERKLTEAEAMGLREHFANLAKTNKIPVNKDVAEFLNDRLLVNLRNYFPTVTQVGNKIDMVDGTIKINLVVPKPNAAPSLSVSINNGDWRAMTPDERKRLIDRFKDPKADGGTYKIVSDALSPPGARSASAP